MALIVHESPESRDLAYGANGGGMTLRYNVITSAGETEAQVYLAALAGSFAYFNGFIRNDIKVLPNGAPHLFKVEIAYGTTGVGGGEEPLGGADSDDAPPPTPEAPATDAEVLTSGWSFSIRAPKLHFTRSRDTISATNRGAGVAPDFKGVVGVDVDRKVVGVDWPPEPAFTFKRTFARASVDLAYLTTLAGIAGKTNDDTFYGFDAECVILLEADGQYTQGEGWSITLGFGVELAEEDIEICDGLEVPYKAGFNYLWVLLKDDNDLTAEAIVTVPRAAYVEQLVRPAAFGALEIGE